MNRHGRCLVVAEDDVLEDCSFEALQQESLGKVFEQLDAPPVKVIGSEGCASNSAKLHFGEAMIPNKEKVVCTRTPQLLSFVKVILNGDFVESMARNLVSEQRVPLWNCSLKA